MPINILDKLTEIALWLLLFGMTFSNSATEAFAISIIGFFIIKRIMQKSYSPPRTPANLALYILCAVTFVTFLRSGYPNESIRGFLRIIKFMFLFFALTEFFGADAKRVKRAFWVIMAAACVTFLNGIFQSIYGFDILRHKELIKDDYLRRISASFVHPNDFGAYIIFVLPLTFCFFSPLIKKGGKAFLLMNCLLGSYCLLKTSSRSAWLGFLLGIIAYFFFYKKKISILVPAALVFLVILMPHGFERTKALFTLEHNTVWERAQLWKGAWKMVTVHPILGFGVNTFSRYFLEYKPPAYPDIRYAHNSYLQMWSEIGILGLGAFLGAIFVILKSVLSRMREKMGKDAEGLLLLGLVSGYIAFLVQAGLDTNLYSLVLTTLFWVMSAYMVSVNKILEEGGP